MCGEGVSHREVGGGVTAGSGGGCHSENNLGKVETEKAYENFMFFVCNSLLKD